MLLVVSYCAMLRAFRTNIESDLISGSVSDVNNNKFENHKNSTFKYFLLPRKYGW